MSKKPFRQRETVQDGKLQVQKGVVSARFVKYTGTEVLSVSFSFTLLNTYCVPYTLPTVLQMTHPHMKLLK